MPHEITGQHKAEESVAALSNLNIASHEAWHMNKLPEACIHLQDRKETRRQLQTTRSVHKVRPVPTIKVTNTAKKYVDKIVYIFHV